MQLNTPFLGADVSETFNYYYSGSQLFNFGSHFTATVSFTMYEGQLVDLNSVSVTARNATRDLSPVSLVLNNQEESGCESTDTVYLTFHFL